MPRNWQASQARGLGVEPSAEAASIVGSGQGGGKFVVLEMLVSGDIIAVGLAMSLAMGLAGGILPSIWAMLIRPLESLR